MRTCVIFNSRYGKTEKDAKSFEAGLERVGISVAILRFLALLDFFYGMFVSLPELGGYFFDCSFQYL
jgi:flavodoxin